MSKNDFRRTFIFKVIVMICKKHVEFCRKTSTYVFTQKIPFNFLYVLFK